MRPERRLGSYCWTGMNTFCMIDGPLVKDIATG
jgi:hypothetical protein